MRIIDADRSRTYGRILVASERHEALALALSRPDTPPIIVNRGSWMRLLAAGHKFQWPYRPHWCISIEDAEDAAEELLAATFDEFGSDVADTILEWRRVNKNYFCKLAPHYMAARELSEILKAAAAEQSPVLIPVDPTSVSIFGLHFEDDSFALFLKSMLPGAKFLDERSGMVLAEDAQLTIKLKLPFSPHGRVYSPPDRAADVLVADTAVSVPWRGHVAPDRRAIVVATGFVSDPGISRAGETTKLLAAARRLGPGTALRKWRLRRTPTITLGPSHAPASFTTTVSALAGDSLLDTVRPWLAQLWVPNLREVRVNARGLLANSRATQVIVADVPFPETAILATEAISAGRDVTLLPHSPTPTDVDQWRTDGRIEPVTLSRTGMLWWRESGENPTLMKAPFSEVVERDPPGPTPVEGSGAHVPTLRMIYVGCFSHEQTYPVFDPESYFSAVRIILDRPSRLRERVTIVVKPRPYWESEAWYRGYGEVERFLRPTDSLRDELASFDIAVVLEIGSTSIFEAIQKGCVAIVVSLDPSAARWRGQTFGRVNTAFSDAIPVITPTRFWDFVKNLADEPSMLQDVRTRQRDWFHKEFGA